MGRSMMRHAHKGSLRRRGSSSRGAPSEGKSENKTSRWGNYRRGSSRRGSSRRGFSRRGSSRRGSSRRGSRRSSYRRRMYKKLIFRHLLSNLNWWIFFTKDVSPPAFPMLVPEVKRKVQNNFRSCFIKKTGIKYDDKINAEQVIEKIKLYKGDQSNITLLVDLTRQCSQNATYQSQFSHCMTRNIGGICMSKLIEQIRARWSRWRSQKENKAEDNGSSSGTRQKVVNKKVDPRKYQLKSTKAEDLENDQITNSIVSNEVSDGSSKDKDDGKNTYTTSKKWSRKRKGRSLDDDDDDDDDDDKKKEATTRRPSRADRIKAWKEKMKNRRKSGGGSWWSKYKRCEPCYNLTSSEQLKTVMKNCWESTSKTSYIMKIKDCMKKSMKDKTQSDRSKEWEGKKLTICQNI